MLTDNRNQVTAYSMSTNRRLGSVFGDLAILSIKSGLLCVQNEPGHVVCHDPQSLARLSELMLPRPVRLAAFSEDGSRLVTVTSDQMVRVFAVSKLRESSASSQRP